MLKRILFIIGSLLILIFILFSLFPSAFAPYELKEMDEPWLKCSKTHLLGTNKLGYDILTEIIYGTRETLTIGVTASILALALGLIFGGISCENNLFGRLSTALINIMAMAPRLITLIVLSTFFYSSQSVMILLIAIFSFAPIAKVIGARVRMLNHESFIESLNIQGFSKMHILLFHIIPNLKDVIATRFLLGINSSIMLEASLSFLGFGDIYHPTWGTMVNLAYKNGAFLRRSFNYLLSPGLAIMLLSLSFYLILLALEDNFDVIKEKI